MRKRERRKIFSVTIFSNYASQASNYKGAFRDYLW